MKTYLAKSTKQQVATKPYNLLLALNMVAYNAYYDVDDDMLYQILC